MPPNPMRPSAAPWSSAAARDKGQARRPVVRPLADDAGAVRRSIPRPASRPPVVHTPFRLASKERTVIAPGRSQARGPQPAAQRAVP